MIHLYAPDWRIWVLKKNYGHELNKIISCFSDDEVLIICQSGDQFEAHFFTEIERWVQTEKHPYQGLVVKHEGRKTPFVFFRGRFLKFPEIGNLPFQNYIREDQLRYTHGEDWMIVDKEEIGYLPTTRSFGWERKKEVEELILPIIQPSHQRIMINTLPIVTIGIATYQSSQTLKWTLQSIWNQTNPNWHLIVYNDGSTDNTSQILVAIQNDPRVTILESNQNKGKSYACNQILAHTCSPWLLELDSDDWLTPNAVDCIVEAVKQLEVSSLKKEKVRFLYGSYYLWEQGEMELRYRGIQASPNWDELDHIIQTGTPICPRIYSTEVLSRMGGWYEKGPCQGRLYEDLELLYRMKTHYHVMATSISSPIYHRRIHPNSVTHQVSNGTYQKWLNYIQQKRE